MSGQPQASMDSAATIDIEQDAPAVTPSMSIPSPQLQSLSPSYVPLKLLSLVDSTIFQTFVLILNFIHPTNTWAIFNLYHMRDGFRRFILYLFFFEDIVIRSILTTIAQRLLNVPKSQKRSKQNLYPGFRAVERLLIVIVFVWLLLPTEADIGVHSAFLIVLCLSRLWRWIGVLNQVTAMLIAWRDGKGGWAVASILLQPTNVFVLEEAVEEEVRKQMRAWRDNLDLELPSRSWTQEGPRNAGVMALDDEAGGISQTHLDLGEIRQGTADAETESVSSLLNIRANSTGGSKRLASKVLMFSHFLVLPICVAAILIKLILPFGLWLFFGICMLLEVLVVHPFLQFLVLRQLNSDIVGGGREARSMLSDGLSLLWMYTTRPGSGYITLADAFATIFAFVYSCDLYRGKLHFIALVVARLFFRPLLFLRKGPPSALLASWLLGTTSATTGWVNKLGLVALRYSRSRSAAAEDAVAEALRAEREKLLIERERLRMREENALLRAEIAREERRVRELERLSEST
ncbi:hypothetical protein BJ742DRAFT_776501 [Cladochytrium replicatum]|nr:hypothetical protein BJ742DRAFT_776501 [Cladochytrium replicatum]